MSRPLSEISLAVVALLDALPRDAGACSAYIARELRLSREECAQALKRLGESGAVVVLPQRLKVPGVNKPLLLYAASPRAEAADSIFSALGHGIVHTCTSEASS